MPGPLHDVIPYCDTTNRWHDIPCLTDATRKCRSGLTLESRSTSRETVSIESVGMHTILERYIVGVEIAQVCKEMPPVKVLSFGLA